MEVFTDMGSVYVIGVYLPQSGCGIAAYQQHLDALESVVEQCSASGDIVVVGDFNAHFSKSEAFSRGWGKLSQNGKKLAGMMDRCVLKPIDMYDICTGPVHAFENDRGQRSYVDHCLVSRNNLSTVVSCEVLEDLLNTSDHLALTCTLKLQSSLEREREDFSVFTDT